LAGFIKASFTGTPERPSETACAPAQTSFDRAKYGADRHRRNFYPSKASGEFREIQAAFKNPFKL
jgi:hypothetical protein